MRKIYFAMVIASLFPFAIMSAQPRHGRDRQETPAMTAEQRIERKVAMMKDRLGLDEGQTEKLTAIFTEQEKSRKEMMEKHQKEMREMCSVYADKAVSLLSDDQKRLLENSSVCRMLYGGDNICPYGKKCPAGQEGGRRPLNRGIEKK